MKIDPIFGFWASQDLKLSRDTCFCGFNSSLVNKLNVVQPEGLTITKM